MITRTGIADTQAPKFAGHEMFSLPYGWPKKAVDATAAVGDYLESIERFTGRVIEYDICDHDTSKRIRWTL